MSLYTCISTCVYINICVRENMCMHIHTLTYVVIRTYTHTIMYVYSHKLIYIYTHTRTRTIDIHTYTKEGKRWVIT